uniref:Uncharacterized protein n=1 Tax=Arundo donax TaxID=35708 RepID=A0A0A9AEP1_ARUDO
MKKNSEQCNFIEACLVGYTTTRQPKKKCNTSKVVNIPTCYKIAQFSYAPQVLNYFLQPQCGIPSQLN